MISAAAAGDLLDPDPFRLRLLDGLSASITERGYRASTVADIVRNARTSKRTFYDRFAGKEECFLELLRADVDKLGQHIAEAVDPQAEWHRQIRQAVEAYVGHIESRQAITLSWIRELPSLGAVARPVQRRGLQLLSSLLIDLSASPGFQRAELPPLTPPLAVILLGGLRELTALAVEDGRPVREIVEPAVDASVALLGPRRRAHRGPLDEVETAMRLSTPNQLKGMIVEVDPGAVMAIVKVKLDGGDQVVTSSVTRDAATDLGLKAGQPATVFIKSTEVTIGVE